MSDSYKKAGVDIQAGNELVQRIKSMGGPKHPQVLDGIGGFAGLFKLDVASMQNPTLVACTDGVGTKLKLALDWNHTADLGQDLVAMCVNDMICSGAKPLFFLDYYACSKLDVDQAQSVLQSIQKSLQQIDCALLGGETAEMPGLYQKNDFDLAGFSVGIVDQNNIINGHSVQEGDVILGLESTGFHSNGYSLIRKIITDHNLNANNVLPNKQTLKEALLAPTQLYVNQILGLMKQVQIKAMSHITGGGLIENLPRCLPAKTKAVINPKAWTPSPIFEFIQNKAQINNLEMNTVFNNGIGFCVICDEASAKKAIDYLQNHHQMTAHLIGEIQSSNNDSSTVEGLS